MIRDVTFSATVTKTVTLQYLWFTPAELDRESRWPLVLFLHGAGERGDNLSLVERHGIPRVTRESPDWPFLACSPQCPAGSHWLMEADAVMALLDSLLATQPIDPRRIYLTGLSMGGQGTWYLGASHPERFAAMVPICGQAVPARAPRLVAANMPIWAFHGEDDDTVPVRQTEGMVQALREAGGHPRVTVYPKTGHDAWTKAYRDPSLYQWLLAQVRDAPSAARAPR